MNKPLIAGLVQHACQDSPADNLDASINGIRQAAAEGANLILLPELHRTQYFCKTEDIRYFELAESIPGPTSETLAGIARELGIVVIGSVFERRAAGLYHNTAIVIDRDGSLAGQYRKMHIPDDPGYYEKFYFTPGDIGFKPVQTTIGKLGVLVCWDQWFPEAARLMALADACILIYPTAIGWEPDDNVEEKQVQLDAWITIQRAHAIANALPVMACNRIGAEKDDNTGHTIDFWGNSFIAGPQGEIVASAGSSELAVLTARIEISNSEKIRRLWPFFRDRRIDAYADLTKYDID